MSQSLENMNMFLHEFAGCNGAFTGGPVGCAIRVLGEFFVASLSRKEKKLSRELNK